MKSKLLFICSSFLTLVANANITLSIGGSELTYLDFIPADGVADAYSGPFMMVGEIDMEGDYDEFVFDTKAIGVGYVNFFLPDIPAGMTLESATLNWALTVYNPNGNNTLGSLQLFHTQENNLPGPPNYTYFNDFAQPDHSGGSVASLDVTSLVLSDYDNDSGTKLTEFTFEVQGITFNDDGKVAAYLFRNDSFNYPEGELSLVFAPIPEPHNLSLILGLISLICVRTRWSRQRLSCA